MVRIGDKVICIKDAFEHWKEFGFSVPIKNELYTIREVNYFSEAHYQGYAFKFSEIKNPIFRFTNMTEEVSFRDQFFLPIDEYINSIEFEKLEFEPLLKLKNNVKLF